MVPWAYRITYTAGAQRTQANQTHLSKNMAYDKRKLPNKLFSFTGGMQYSSEAAFVVF